VPGAHGREGGGKQQVLPVGWQQIQQLADFGGKAQIQQPVGFIQYQRTDGGQAQRIVLQQIQQPARCGHHDVGTAAQRHHLRVDGNTAIGHHHLGVARQTVAQFAQGVTHLDGQLPRGQQNQPAQLAAGVLWSLSHCCSSGRQ
jgi:hypothetical protein